MEVTPLRQRAGALGAGEPIRYLSSLFSLSATEAEPTAQANKMTYGYSSKLHRLQRACKATELSERHIMFHCHTGERTCAYQRSSYQSAGLRA